MPSLSPRFSGKAFAGLVAEIATGRFDGRRDIVFVHTGGIFGLFPQRAGFAELLKGGHKE
jgi:D-cysteine desulfhydrase